MSATIINDSPDTLGVTLYDSDGVTVLVPLVSIAPGGSSQPGSFYRWADIQVISPSAVTSVFPAYLSDRASVLILGSSTVGYRVEEVDQGNYEFTFWGGFSITVVIFLVLYYVRAIRLASRPILD